jgi:hypothetical protein
MNPQFPHMVALFWVYAGLLVASARPGLSPGPEAVQTPVALSRPVGATG